MSKADRVATSQFDDYCTDSKYHEERYELITRYFIAQKAAIGSKIKCAYCSKIIIKKHYRQRFCNTKCKNKYWNFIDSVRKARAKIWNK